MSLGQRQQVHLEMRHVNVSEWYVLLSIIVICLWKLKKNWMVMLAKNFYQKHRDLICITNSL